MASAKINFPEAFVIISNKSYTKDILTKRPKGSITFQCRCQFLSTSVSYLIVANIKKL